LRQGQVIGIFPQGGIRAPSGDGDEGKAGVALLALRTGAPVVPLYVEGSPPHVESVLWDFLRRSRSSVRVGSPLRFDQREGKPSREELESCTERVMEAIQGLAE
jgi:1-acyl-sn-glycerol-3-phosphate acyltransferase